MDTPHLTAADLADVADRVGDGNDAVLGAADDGGWWVLAVTDHRLARCLRDVEMSTGRTHAETLAALRRDGCTSGRHGHAARRRHGRRRELASPPLAPGTRFARLWSSALGGV